MERGKGKKKGKEPEKEKIREKGKEEKEKKEVEKEKIKGKEKKGKETGKEEKNKCREEEKKERETEKEKEQLEGKDKEKTDNNALTKPPLEPLVRGRCLGPAPQGHYWRSGPSAAGCVTSEAPTGGRESGLLGHFNLWMGGGVPSFAGPIATPFPPSPASPSRLTNPAAAPHPSLGLALRKKRSWLVFTGPEQPF